jgi:deoxyribonuclease V
MTEDRRCTEYSSLKSHVWPKDINEAKAVQMAAKDLIKIMALKKNPRLIAAVDASFTDEDVIGVACLYTYPELSYIGCETAVKKITFPYVPGYLTFREGPAVTEALNSLKIKPHLILVDGQGIAHPKGIGIASHLGVLLDLPTIGCAKSRLVGEHKEPGFEKGDWSPLRYNGKVVGAVLRTRANVRPVFVSPGHRIDLETSIKIVIGCTDKFRIPEPLRRADFLSKEMKREFLAQQRLP